MAEPTRKAVVVTADSIYTGAIEGDEPISKYTDDSGRKVLEMLTPEQATQKLRRNEESFFVGRGQGVVRYDVVQIPSNDPIEDDHSEKIERYLRDWQLPLQSTTQIVIGCSGECMTVIGNIRPLPEVLKLISLQRLDDVCKAAAGSH